MKRSPDKWLPILALRCLLVAFASLPFQLSAQIVPSEPKSIEWKEPHPQVDITNSDKYIEYTRNGKVVYRAIERTVTVSMPSNPKEKPSTAIQHWIQFIADGKVFATVSLDKGNANSWTLNSNIAVHFSSAFADLERKSRAFHVCVPKLDYYEYVEISDHDIKLRAEPDATYTTAKKAFIKMTEEGNLRTPY